MEVAIIAACVASVTSLIVAIMTAITATENRRATKELANHNFEQAYLQELAKTRLKIYMDLVELFSEPLKRSHVDTTIQSTREMIDNFIGLMAQANIFISEDLSIILASCSKLFAEYTAHEVTPERHKEFSIEYGKLMHALSSQAAIELLEKTDLNSIKKVVLGKHETNRTLINQIIAGLRYENFGQGDPPPETKE